MSNNIERFRETGLGKETDSPDCFEVPLGPGGRIYISQGDGEAGEIVNETNEIIEHAFWPDKCAWIEVENGEPRLMWAYATVVME